MTQPPRPGSPIVDGRKLTRFELAVPIPRYGNRNRARAHAHARARAQIWLAFGQGQGQRDSKIYRGARRGKD
jgi:hypothetical protein